MHLGLVIFPVSVSALFEKPCNADRRRSPSTLTASESSVVRWSQDDQSVCSRMAHPG